MLGCSRLLLHFDQNFCYSVAHDGSICQFKVDSLIKPSHLPTIPSTTDTMVEKHIRDDLL